jgi:hypothetical protein
MAISRAQLLKELLPGLNALFGLSMLATVKNTKRFMKQKPLSVLLKKKQNCLASQPLRLRTKVLQLLMTMRKKLGQLATITKLSPLALA